MPVKYSELSKEAKQRRNRQNAASRARYEKAAYKKYSLRVRTDGGDGFTPDQMEQAAAVAGQSVNAWILTAIRQQIGSGEQQANSETTAGAGVALTAPELVQAVNAAAEAAGMTAREWLEDLARREIFGS